MVTMDSPIKLNNDDGLNPDAQRYANTAKATCNQNTPENIVDMISQYSKNLYETASLKKSIEATSTLSKKQKQNFK